MHEIDTRRHVRREFELAVIAGARTRRIELIGKSLSPLSSPSNAAVASA